MSLASLAFRKKAEELRNSVVPSDPRGLRRAPLNFDAPAHTPYRRALERTIKPARIKKLEDRLEVIAEREFQAFLQDGNSDICSGFAALFPAYVEALWLKSAFV